MKYHYLVENQSPSLVPVMILYGKYTIKRKVRDILQELSIRVGTWLPSHEDKITGYALQGEERKA